MPEHEAVSGQRIPASPEKKQSSYEVTCKCDVTFSDSSWDNVLDRYLDHVDEAALVAA
jgi:hypothetical protein